MMTNSTQSGRYSLNRITQSIVLILCFVSFSFVLLHITFTFAANQHQVYNASKSFQSPQTYYPKIHNDVKRRWRRLGSEDAYVFSAYYKPFEHTVEIVGIVRKNKLNSTFNCLFPDSEGRNGTYRYSAMLENAGEDYRPVRYWYQAVYIRCSLPMHIKPSIVNLEMKGNSTTMPIIYRDTRNIYNLSVCYPSFFKTFSYHDKLISAIESNILFGVQFFTVYKHSVTDEVNKVFNYYVEHGLMEVIDWNIPVTKILHDGQFSHIQDCRLSHMYKSKFVMVLDVDELIVPHKHTNLLDMIRDVEKNVKQSTGSYRFRHAFFVVDNDTDSSSFPQKQDVEQLHITSLQHVWRSGGIFKPCCRPKSIYIPPRVMTAGIHFTLKMMYGFQEHIVDPSIAFVHHYRSNPPDVIKNASKDTYMRNYTSELVTNVKYVYKMLGFKQ